MRNNRLIFCLLSGIALCSAAAKRGVTPEDYYRFRFVSDPNLSPDGKQVAYVVTQVNEKHTGRASTIWLSTTHAPVATRRFTFAGSANRPRWRPDGASLAYLSARQIHLSFLDAAEPRKLTALPNGVSDFAWSPDGKWIALVTKSGPKPANDELHYQYSSIKHNGRGYFDTLRTHIWILNPETGETRQLTSGDQRNDRDPVWSPDGSQIAFTAEHTDRQCCAAQAVYTVAASGGPPRTVAEGLSSAQLPLWRQSGQPPIFAGAKPGAMATIQLPGAPDLAPTSLTQSSDGQTLYFTAPSKGAESLFSWKPGASGAQPIIAGARAVKAVDRNEAAGVMVYTAASPNSLEDLYAAQLNGSSELKLTHLNTALWDELEIPELERVHFQAADGLALEGFLLKPIHWRAGQSYPMVLSIHGGPASMYGVSWFHEFHVYAAKGWAVFFMNPRGSAGYGEKFERLVELEWGGKAYTDIMSGVDTVLSRYPWIDRSRLGVTGGSYGGFMTNWIVTQTNRFKAAVTLRSISNFMSIEGTRDAAYSHAKDFGGDLYQNPELYWKYSAVRLAANVKTPTLVLHSDNDQRVPLEQGEQWFRALQHHGVPSEFVIFPGGDHDLTRTGVPRQLVESLQWQLYWFDRYLAGSPNASPPARH
jgi:dipeptidyl aminopeptidase/acylaminoacyl peptidase